MPPSGSGQAGARDGPMLTERYRIASSLGAESIELKATMRALVTRRSDVVHRCP